MLELCGLNHAFMPLEVLAIVMSAPSIVMKNADIDHIYQKVTKIIIDLQKVQAGLLEQPGEKTLGDLSINLCTKEIIELLNTIDNCITHQPVNVQCLDCEQCEEVNLDDEDGVVALENRVVALENRAVDVENRVVALEDRVAALEDGHVDLEDDEDAAWKRDGDANED